LAISRERKEELLAQYEEDMQKSRAVILTEYRGLNTPDMERLREIVRDANGGYSVIKLTLFKLALEQAGYPVPEELLDGPVAVGFCYEEIPAMAKALRDFAKEREALVLKGGIMADRILSSADVVAMAELPPLDVLRAQLIGLISGPARNLAGVVASGVRQVVNVLNAYAEKDQQEAGAEA
jgi:large subunit ribosomal protein L10